MVQAVNKNPDEIVEKADEEFEKKNYRDAANLYEELLKLKPEHERWIHASERIIMCNLRLQLYEDALKAAERYIERCKATPQEARAERLTGNLYMLLPHWGTRSGGTFYRGEWKQGIQLRTYLYDKDHALAHMERARNLYEEYDTNPRSLASLPEKERKNWHNERIECVLDLVNILSRFGIYENEWHFWYNYWGERDEFIAETAGEEDFEEYHPDWELRRKRPIGLRLDENGNPLFPSTPQHYLDTLSDDEKILYLLEEVRDLDTTENHKYAGESYFRQAMLARVRFGMDRMNQYASFYQYNNTYPLKEELETFIPWELEDSEGLVLAGGKLRKVDLPLQWDVLSLLRTVVSDYADCGMAGEAQYSVGLYYQSRQQYRSALKEYERLQVGFEDEEWESAAESQISKIKSPQVRIHQTGVQMPGTPAEVQISYRNTSKIWFIARKIDHEKFMNSIRNQDVAPDKGLRGFHNLANWHWYFVNRNVHDEWLEKLAEECIGGETARWVSEVKDDGTYRYAETILSTPLDEPGAYLVYAYLEEPPERDKEKMGKEALELGNSRAAVVLTDLAMVEKKVKNGTLYFICDAQTGVPLPKASLNVVEVWSEWKEELRKNVHYKKVYDLMTDENGFALLQEENHPNHWSQMHTLVKAGAQRLAWSGMSYWHPYSPSSMASGLFAFCITDRPVYRPEQTVRYKIWIRQMQQGNLEMPSRNKVEVIIYDPRGNRIHTVTHYTDEYGGIDGEFTLGEEPPLGMYRILISGSYYRGGETFRVEEYKKPEFEVTVEPDTTHTKLGEKITAVIKATHYFGSPVTDATVSYKVFREEYTHTYFFPGEWDWLYGDGYGLPWYEYPWFSWWERLSCCWRQPDWWSSYFGSAAFQRGGFYPMGGYHPVRELVKQAETRIGEDGTVKVEIDTTPALRDHPDRDHRYVIEAEVRDASRRVITGEGAVKVTRQAYYAFIQSNRGYYRPGEEMRIRLRCLTPDNKPVQTEGVITVSSVVFGGRDNARIEETQLKRWKAGTDENGLHEFMLRHEKSGLLKIKFESPDQWGGIVEGFGLVWVCGDDFDGSLYRFNNLEIITDKRSYQPGETAHVMLNTQHKNSHVLFSSNVDNNHLLDWRLLYLPQRHTVVDIPITEEHRPNFFIEATTVFDTRVHQQAAQICVPPEEGVLDLSVETDKAEYKPGGKARVKITAQDLDGNPVKAQIVLSVFDKSVLYIQPEYTPEIAKFFHGRLRHHNVQMSTNLYEQFSAWGYVHRPFTRLDPYPSGWFGRWGFTGIDWRTIDERTLGIMEGTGTYFMREERMLGDVSRQAAPALEAQVRAADSLSFKAGAIVTEVPASSPSQEAPAFVEAEVRTEFADTALWLTSLETDEDGTAEATFDMPENLTTWKVNSWAMTRQTRVGEASTSAVTTKNLLVRLQAPRFFMEYDEVVISANVHNYLDEDKTARVSLDIPEEYLKLIGDTPAMTDVNIRAGSEARVDWRVKVVKEGSVDITVKALTDEESDAMKMTFPVLVHGITKQVATTGSMRPDEVKKTITVELQVPEKRRPELTRLEVQYAPTLVGAMMDALPYCIYYPYGCTEQTMSRFVPSVLTLKTLQNMGISLEEVKNIRGRLEEVRSIEEGEHVKFYWNNPIFDTDELNAMIEQSLTRITNMQHGDGGWGWWVADSSSSYLTGYVLWALCTAQRCDLQIDENIIRRGMEFLRSWEIEKMKETDWKPHARHAYNAYVLSLKKMRADYDPPKEDERSGDLVERLFERRDVLGLYGKALLAMTLANLDQMEQARLVLDNIMQYREENLETQVAWFRTPQKGWWYWWNSDIETNATILSAIVRIEPNNETAPRLVKWLLNNRRNGYYWRSTRDTTLCVAAMSDFVVATGESEPDFTLTLDFDNGAVTKTVKITRDNFFTYDNCFVLEGATLSGGKHTLKITKEGVGALYFNTYLRYFSKEEHITAAGHELKVDRTYFKLEQIPYEVEVEGAEGQKIVEKRLRYERIPVKSGDMLMSGDVIQVELRVASDNDYTYLCFEDMKPAGCEPTEVRSGGKGQEGFWSYMELRDEKVVFFANSIAQGEHLLRYRLRAEIPGIFHALPTVVYGMYVPELRANSDENIIVIQDK